jgi:putative Mg2+ transporter-C (MgtC) family protein
LETFRIIPQLVALAVAYALVFPDRMEYLEREDRTAGLRTFPLVALAACGFVQMAEPWIRLLPRPWRGSLKA